MDKVISGYLECDGSIVKISSLEDVNNFILSLGKTVEDISEKYLFELTEKDGDQRRLDDIPVYYIQNPLILKKVYCSKTIPETIDSYKVKDGTIAISKGAFKPRLRLKSIYMPDSILVIGSRAFWNNTNLSEVRLSTRLEAIGDSAFYGCTSLTNLSLPNGLKYIGKNAFEACGLVNIDIPRAVIKIGAFTFEGCDKLRNIRFLGIPDNISSGIFTDCKSIENVIVPQGSRDYFIKELFPLPESKIIEEKLKS